MCPRVIDSRPVNDLSGLGPSCRARALRIQVNCISIDPVFISICREFMCELSEKEHRNRGRERERRRLVRRMREGERKRDKGRIERGTGRWHDLLASFLGTLSLTTIQFAFHPINRAFRCAFADIHGYVFSREFFIFLPQDAGNVAQTREYGSDRFSL